MTRLRTTRAGRYWWAPEACYGERYPWATESRWLRFAGYRRRGPGSRWTAATWAIRPGAWAYWSAF